MVNMKINVSCNFLMENANNVMFLRYYDSGYDTNIYDYFYHYILYNLKLTLCWFIKVFIASHNDSHKLVKLYSILIYFNL